MKYKIGEIAKWLNVPAETLRYYEKKRIITPVRDANNNYRYYDEWDVYNLLDYMRLRNYEFTMAETDKIKSNENFENYISEIDSKLSDFQDKILYYSQLASYTEEYKNSLEIVQKKLWNIDIVEEFGYYYFLQSDHDYFMPMITEWKRYSIFTNHIIFFNLQDVNCDSYNDTYSWGFGIEKTWVDKLSLNLNQYVNFWEMGKYLKTVICIENKNKITYGLLKDVFQYMKNNGYIAKDGIMGKILAVIKDNGGWTRYIEIIIPIV